MRILFVTNMYPAKSDPVYGVFVKEQISDILSALNPEHDLYYINAKKGSKLMYLFSIFSIPLRIFFRKYDIIHIHYGISALFLLLFQPKAKTFITLHGADILIKQGNKVQVFLTKKILLRAHKVLILNDEMEEIVRSLKVNYEIIPCGVNTEFFKPFRIHERNNFKLVLFPGNPLVGVKNYCLFEKVIAELQKTPGLEIRFQCVHNLTREGVRKLLNKADCLLMTSISEGSPQVIKEALFCGLPVVSVPVGDVKVMVNSVPHCYISSSYNAEELSKLVIRSFEGKGQAIRQAFLDKKIYDSGSVTNRIIQNYIAS